MKREIYNEEHELFRASARRFVEERVAPFHAQWEKDGQVSREVWREAGEGGFLCCSVPEEYGGVGGDFRFGAVFTEELARMGTSGPSFHLHSEIVAPYLIHYGTEEQKRKWLPDIVSGQRICSIAGTEPGAGSDTAGFTTRARRLDDGGWSLTGEKAYITNPGTDISSFTLILAVSSPKDAETRKYTLFLTPNDTPGYTRGEKYKKMGWRSSDTRPLYLDDCKLPAGAVVGEVDGGRWVLHKGYQAARLFLSTCSLGLAQASLDHALAYAKERQAFGGSLGKLQLIQEMIANMAVKVDCARLLTYRAAWQVDAGKPDLKALSMAKLYATEIGSEVANMAIQVHGGWGFMDDCPVSRYLRDNRVCTIGDGSSQIQTLLIARECGLDVTF